MIQGVVHGGTDAIVELAVRGPEGEDARLDFRVDTGFDGALSLHSAVVAALALPPTGVQRVALADGSVVRCDVCKGFVEWGGVTRPVEIQVADSISLLGMALLAGHELRIEVVDGGFVGISPMVQPGS